MPFAIAPRGQPIPSGLTASYLIDSIVLSKLLSVILNTPRLSSVTLMPRGIPYCVHYEVRVTLGG